MSQSPYFSATNGFVFIWAINAVLVLSPCLFSVYIHDLPSTSSRCPRPHLHGSMKIWTKLQYFSANGAFNQVYKNIVLCFSFSQRDSFARHKCATQWPTHLTRTQSSLPGSFILQSAFRQDVQYMARGITTERSVTTTEMDWRVGCFRCSIDPSIDQDVDPSIALPVRPTSTLVVNVEPLSHWPGLMCS